jgi:hypothetical protein
MLAFRLRQTSGEERSRGRIRDQRVMLAGERAEWNRPEPTGIEVSLTNADDVCCSLWEALSQNATCLVSAAVERYDSSTNKSSQAPMCSLIP